MSIQTAGGDRLRTPVRQRLGRAIAAAVAISALLSQPVSAGGGAYGWGACTWENNPYHPSGNIEVRAEYASYPGPSLVDGVWNSFTARISSAIADWNSNIDVAGTININLYRIPDDYYFEDIIIYQASISAWADHQTYATASCSMHVSSESYAQWERIRTRIYDHWFTQDDSRRVLWENCPNTGSPAYTCSKLMDFESILMHELGHAMGLPHPQSVDTHQPSLSPDSASLASCGTSNDRATMCSNIAQQHKSSGRTLHYWDRESLRQAGVYH